MTRHSASVAFSLVLLVARCSTHIPEDGCHKMHKKCNYNFESFVLSCDDSSYTKIPHPRSFISRADPQTAHTILINSSCVETLDGISDYKYVERIDLSHNMIQMINVGKFAGNRRLQRIDLSDNKIDKVHQSAFEGLAKLKFLSLAKNSIEVIPRGVFANLPSLERLDLTNNRIISLNNGAIGNLGNLTYLNLSRNQLTTFDAEILLEMNRIEVLDLRFNNITTITNSQVFTTRNFLQVFLLSHNKLTMPNPQWFHKITQLSSVLRYPSGDYLSSNPWSCACGIYKYWQFVMENSMTPEWKNALEVRCSGPPNLQGLMISNLNCDSDKECPCSPTTATEKVNIEENSPKTENPPKPIVLPTKIVSKPTTNPPKTETKQTPEATSKRFESPATPIITTRIKTIATTPTTKETTVQVAVTSSRGPNAGVIAAPQTHKEVVIGLAAFIVVGIVALVVCALVFLYRKRREARDNDLGPQTTDPGPLLNNTRQQNQNRNDHNVTPLIEGSQSHKNILTDPNSETLLKLPLATNTESRPTVFNAYKDLNGVHHNPPPTQRRIARNRHDSAYESICEDPNTQPHQDDINGSRNPHSFSQVSSDALNPQSTCPKAIRQISTQSLPVYCSFDQSIPAAGQVVHLHTGSSCIPMHQGANAVLLLQGTQNSHIPQVLSRGAEQMQGQFDRVVYVPRQYSLGSQGDQLEYNEQVLQQSDIDCLRLANHERQSELELQGMSAV